MTSLLRVTQLFKLINLAVLGLSCGMQGLSLQHVDSLVLARGLSGSTACGSVLRPGFGPTSLALQGRFLTTAPSGKSQGHTVLSRVPSPGLSTVNPRPCWVLGVQILSYKR